MVLFIKKCERYGLALCCLYLSFFVVGCGDVMEQRLLPAVDSLRSGDIVFRKGGSAANIFLSAAQSRTIYTHVGLLVVEDGVAKVVHSVPDEAAPGDYDRVKVDCLEDFFMDIRAFAGGIYRVDSLSARELDVVTREAMRWYGKGVPFDSEFVLGDTTALYCTELLMLCFHRVGYDITGGCYTELNTAFYEGHYIFPSDLLESGNLRKIYDF